MQRVRGVRDVLWEHDYNSRPQGLPEPRLRAAHGVQERCKQTCQLKEADADIDRDVLAKFTTRPFNTLANTVLTSTLNDWQCVSTTTP